ncbi:MAG: hypothetical protein ABI780_11070 [Ardenticatenales bacterium]
MPPAPALRRPAAPLALAFAVALTFTASPTPAAAQPPSGTYVIDLTIPFDPAPDPAAATPWLVGRIKPVPLGRDTSTVPELAEADGRLIVLDAGGAVLHSRLVARWRSCDDNDVCDESEHADVSIPYFADAQRVELHRIDGAGRAVELKAAKDRSAGPPVVRILRPRDGETIGDGTVIEWRATDADGDELDYDVLYRPSVGYWRQLPLDVGTHETRIVFRRGDLPADTRAVIAIVAHDGFNSTVATVTGLTIIGNLPPRLYLMSPNDGRAYPLGSNVILHARADDPEDGDLPVVWRSDRDGVIPQLNWTTGSRGIHTMSASATDSGGLTSLRTLRLYIGVEPPILRARVYLPIAGE